MSEELKDQISLSAVSHIGVGAQIFAHVLLIAPERISIGEGVRIDDYVKIEGGTGVTIERYVHIASFASILGGGEATLGEFAGLAQGARIVTGGGHPFSTHFPKQPPAGDPFDRKRGRVAVGPYAFIGVNAVVLPGVSLGEGAVAAAGSVVTQDVPDWTIVAGTPARPVKQRINFSS